MANDLDRVLNCHWWAKALADRHALDMSEHVGPRAHQRVSHATADNVPGPGYVLTEWDKAWLRARVEDCLRDKLVARNEASAGLAEPQDAHEARVLDERARSYFDGTHAATRTKFEALRDRHAEPCSCGLPDDEHAQLLKEIDGHIVLVQRHIDTVLGDVAEQRRLWQVAVDEATLVTATPYEDLVQSYTARIEAEVRDGR